GAGIGKRAVILAKVIVPKLLMPAVTLAGALALAGCGGGSDGPAVDTDPDPVTIKLVKGAYFGDDTNRYTCDADDGCEYTRDADGEVQETPAQLRTAGFVITTPENPRTCGTGTVERDGVCYPDTTDADAAAAALELERTWSALRNDRASVGSLDFDTADKVTGTLDYNGTDSGGTDGNTVTLEKTNAVVRAITGWKGAEYAKDDDDDRHRAVIYHNQAAPTATPFATKHADNIVAAAAGVPAHVLDDNFGTLKITGFPTGNRNVTHTATVAGTLDGAQGTFACNFDQACTSLNGRPAGGDWRFIPARNAMAMTEDGSFIRFGYWTERPEEDSSDDWGNLANFVDPTGANVVSDTGTDENTNPTAVQLVGKATYKGGAA
ncbi:MAG: hypothetical protein OXD36_11475, partial [Rhodobacter sp.]|nr:hypothetical protein [Rhodobacter sp.]